MFVLEQRNGPTNIKIMKIVKSEKQNIDITVDNVTYMPDVVNEGEIIISLLIFNAYLFFRNCKYCCEYGDN